MAISERVSAFITPFFSAAAVGGGDHAQLGQGVGILLPLDDEDDGLRISGDNFWEVVENAPDFGDLVDETAVTVWPTLEKFLGVFTNNLVEKNARFIPIVVGGDDPADLAVAVLGEQITHLQAQGLDNSARLASGVTFDQDGSIGSGRDGQAGVVVVVTGAKGDVSFPGFANPLEPLQDLLDVKQRSLYRHVVVVLAEFDGSALLVAGADPSALSDTHCLPPLVRLFRTPPIRFRPSPTLPCPRAQSPFGAERECAVVWIQQQPAPSPAASIWQ
jgi:hypothetical protein